MKSRKATNASQTMTDTSNPRSTKVRLDEETCVFNEHLRIDRYQLTHKRHDGDWSRLIQREVMSRRNAVAVLLFDPYRQEVLLIEQFRIGAWVSGEASPWLLECVAGLIEEGEDTEEVAIRETLEEAGCSLIRLMPIAKYLTTPGCSSEQVNLFCGQIDATGASGYYGVDEEDEDICANVWSIDDALQLLDDGKIGNSMTIIALQWLALHHVTLTTHWITNTNWSP